MMLLGLAVTLALCVTGSNAFTSPTDTTQVRRLQPFGSSLSKSEYDDLCGLLGNNTTLTLLYKSSSAGTAYGDMLACVENKPNVVIVIRNAQYAFGAFISEGIRLPAFNSTTGMMPRWHGYESDVWFFSLAGHYENATKIEIDQQSQDVLVASQIWGNPMAPCFGGLVPRYNARVVVGRDLSLGRSLSGGCWPLSTDDIRKGRQSTDANDVPEGYMGVTDENGNALLGGSRQFIADEIEIFAVK
ncbi:unnamed protein product [Vitrella brassicaformis CCMP3155]|uniref:TLDc domain-containing protein n=2 Tax=Vitrella brassicaformis TaxID=1169539 RepID=A0A0G4FXF4_VITBC|nr:unnamed protein product [Vitrella brassicaformis CCMP3155]|eukprot:CEM19545.1 unnamed protein product [Vitrella brassicaformis CCMP3155]